MTKLRVAVVSRRFWPVAGREERSRLRLIEALHAGNVEVTVFTAQGPAPRPGELVVGPAHVVRLPYPNVRGWGMVRFMWSVASTLRAQRNKFDAVIVVGLAQDTYAAVTALRGSGVPVIVQVTESGEQGDCRRQQEATFANRMRKRCSQAELFVASSEQVAEELAEFGYDERRIIIIPPCANLVPLRDPALRTRARADLSEAYADFGIAETVPAAVYTGRWTQERGLRDMLFAWQMVIRAWPEAQLWLIGDGPIRDELYEHCRDLNLKYHTSMPGAFDDVTDLLYAADVHLSPAREDGSTAAILEAMAAGLPIVATDLPIHRTAVVDREHGLLVPAGNPASLAEAVAESFTVPRETAKRVDAARRRVEREFSLDVNTERWLDCLHRVIRR